MDDKNDINDRLGSLEKNYHTISQDVAALTAAVQGLADNVRRLTEGAKTNWTNIASWVGVMLIMLGLVFYEPMRSIDNMVHHHIKDGHPISVTEKFEAVDEGFQRNLSKNSQQLSVIEQRLDKLDTDAAKSEERLLDIEREVYSGASYRAGRPIKNSNK